MSILILILLGCFCLAPTAAFTTPSPILHRPSFISQSSPSTNSRKSTHLQVHDGPSSLNPGDTVLIVGGTGGVGQLVTKKLANKNKYKLRVTARDEQRGKSIIDDDNIEIVELDLTKDNVANEQALEAAVDDVAAIVIATGTTAFPTTKWAGGNTPYAVDELAVRKVSQAAAKIDGMKRVVLLTSIGVERRKEMPFSVLNLFGVLDAKRNGEKAVITAAAEGEYDYAIVRPGRLVGGPYTNLDLAKLMQIEGGAENGVTVQAGDTLVGDCKRDACAEAVVQCLENPECTNLEFSVVSNEDKALTEDQWTEQFVMMSNS